MSRRVESALDTRTYDELAGIAYERELSHNLTVLTEKFMAWQQGQINCWQLSEAIHDFHDGLSRDLFKLYNYEGNKSRLVARALAFHLIETDEVPSDLFQEIKNDIRFYE